MFIAAQFTVAKQWKQPTNKSMENKCGLYKK